MTYLEKMFPIGANVASYSVKAISFHPPALMQASPVDAFVRFASNQPVAQSFVIDQPPVVDLKNMAPYEQLIEQAKRLSLPQVSGYQVGEVALGKSGRAYLGVNVEIKGGDYSDTIHGEQFLYALARKNKESGIRQIVISAEPCGHCRQFMMEGGDPGVKIIHQVSNTGDSKSFSGMTSSKVWNETTLGTLVPGPFILATPQNNLFNAKPLNIVPVLAVLNPLEQAAVEVAKTSYTPLSKDTWAGIAILTTDQRVYTGSVIESAAYNPTLPPLQDAIVGMVADHQPLGNIDSVVLVEPLQPNFSYVRRTENALKALAPHATFRVIKANGV